jgi:hypothetical protein
MLWTTLPSLIPSDQFQCQCDHVHQDFSFNLHIPIPPHYDEYFFVIFVYSHFLYNSIHSKILRLEFFFNTFQLFAIFSCVYVRTTKTNARFEFVRPLGHFFFFLKGFGGGGFCLPTSYSFFFCMGALSLVKVNLPLCLVGWSFLPPSPYVGFGLCLPFSSLF